MLGDGPADVWAPWLDAEVERPAVASVLRAAAPPRAPPPQRAEPPAAAAEGADARSAALAALLPAAHAAPLPPGDHKQLAALLSGGLSDADVDLALLPHAHAFLALVKHNPATAAALLAALDAAAGGGDDSNVPQLLEAYDDALCSIDCYGVSPGFLEFMASAAQRSACVSDRAVAAALAGGVAAARAAPQAVQGRVVRLTCAFARGLLESRPAAVLSQIDELEAFCVENVGRCGEAAQLYARLVALVGDADDGGDGGCSGRRLGG